MFQSLRASSTKLALTVTMILTAAGGTVAAVTAGSAGAATGAKATATRAAPPPVDHHLCYTAAAPAGFKIPTGVVLKNQFSPKGFKPKITKAVLHCNPVAKTLPTGKVFKITNPAAHLLCFTITAARQPVPTVVVTNQFGKAKLVPSQPNLLCLPSWKSLTGPPRHPQPQPPRLSHFTCYPVKVAAGAYKPPPVLLQDQFAPQPVRATVNPVPAELCLPTEKIVGTHDFKIVNAATHLLCFPVTKTPIKPTVWDQNQFGTGKVSIRQTRWLCVPSTKQVVTTQR